MLVISTAGARGFLGQLIPWLMTLQLRLYVNDFTPSITTSSADFVEASYDGYAPLALDAWPAPFVNTNNYAESDHPTLTFQVGPGGGSDQSFGYWVTDASRTYLAAERFALSPAPMNVPGATCPVTVRLLSGRLC